jgi:DNA-binding NarL/FixJ family response regulator
MVRRLVAQAALADGWGEPVAWLRESLAVCDEAGMAALAGSCRSLLRAAGSPVPRKGRGTSPPRSELAALGITSREQDVLALIGEGRSNREIAQQLYLSPRTVEKHVGQLLLKTGKGRRTDLVALAHRVLHG